MVKKILLGLLAVLLILQLFRPEKNLSGDRTFALTNTYEMPADVKAIWEVACNDCHANTTRYPWYAEIQPLGWWLDHHVEDGKRHFNIDHFTHRRIAVQNHKFEEFVEMIEEGEMPLPSYTYMGLHSEANLSEEQKATLINWAKAQMADIAANYPADSLVLRRR